MSGGYAVSVEQRYERKIKRGIGRRYSKLYKRLAPAPSAMLAPRSSIWITKIASGAPKLGNSSCRLPGCLCQALDESVIIGLASMYPASDWSGLLRAIMDISARVISLAERPELAIWVTSVHMRREDRTSISS